MKDITDAEVTAMLVLTRRLGEAMLKWEPPAGTSPERMMQMGATSLLIGAIRGLLNAGMSYAEVRAYVEEQIAFTQARPPRSSEPS